jgi:hypothetical protein
MDVVHDGELNASLPEEVVGVLPVSGVVDRVIFTVGTNIVSSLGTDGVEATLKVNSDALCTTRPKITDDAGSGMRSTGRGDGVAAGLDPSVAAVQAGDLLRWSLTLTTQGLITQQPCDIGLAVRILPD